MGSSGPSFPSYLSEPSSSLLFLGERALEEKKASNFGKDVWIGCVYFERMW